MKLPTLLYRRRFILCFLVFGAFLEAPNLDRGDSRVVAKLSLIRTHWSLFRRILKSFDPSIMSKRRRKSSGWAVGDPEGGPQPLVGPRLRPSRAPCLRSSAMAELRR